MSETPGTYTTAATKARGIHVHLVMPESLHRWLIQAHARVQYRDMVLHSFSAFVVDLLTQHRQRVDAQRRQADAPPAPPR